MRIRLGTVGRPHGLRGALRINLDNSSSTALERLHQERLPIFIGGEPHRLRRASPLGARGSSTRAWLVELEGIDSAAAVQPLYQRVVEADRAALAPLEDGEYYYADLVGLACIDEQQQPLGTVSQVYEAGAGDILVLRTPQGERELPFLEDVVLAVELSAGRLILRVPDEELIVAGDPAADGSSNEQGGNDAV